MTSDTTPPPVGALRLYDRVVPPFVPGKYKVVISQEVPTGVTTPVPDERFFEVTGPRWNLESSEVHSTTPSANEANAPDSCYVPTITLQRRTLPWERSIFLPSYTNSAPTTTVDAEAPSQFNGGTTPDNLSVSEMDEPARMNDYPTMALLLFTEEELTFNLGDPDKEYLGIFKADKALKLDANTIHKNLDGSNRTERGIFSHRLDGYKNAMDINDSPDMLVDAVKVPYQTLRSVAPTLEELRLLAHARQVNPQDKETCGTDEDGWFSSFICNRVPQADTKYHACLVSLEGRLSDNILQHSPELNSVYSPSDSLTVRTRQKGNKIAKKTIPHPGEGKKTAKKIKKGKKPKTNPKMGKMYSILNVLMAWPFTGRKRNEPKQNLPAAETGATTGTGGTMLQKEVMNIDNGTPAISERGDENPTLRIEARLTDIPPTSPIMFDSIRLVLLHHWQFSTGSGGDFESRMKKLRVRVRSSGESPHREGELTEKVPLFDDNVKSVACPTCSATIGNYCTDNGDLCAWHSQRITAAEASTHTAIAEPMLLGNSMVRDVTANSYLRTEMVESNGENVECLYRGPFTALPELHQQKEKPYGNSDQARAIIEEIGLEDISHAAAFELGRLLAFNDHNFVKTAARWRQTNYQKQLSAANVLMINSKLGQLDGGNGALIASQKVNNAILNMGLKVFYAEHPKFAVPAIRDIELPPVFGDPGDFGDLDDPPVIDTNPIDSGDDFTFTPFGNYDTEEFEYYEDTPAPDSIPDDYEEFDSKGIPD